MFFGNVKILFHFVSLQALRRMFKKIESKTDSLTLKLVSRR